MQKKAKILLICLVMSMAAVCGCSAGIGGTEQGRTVDYTVIGNDDVPDEFKQQIDGAKNEEMKLTYKDDEYLYIARGYGTKETGGYSISVVQFYVEGKAIYFETKLIEPSQGESVSNQENNPYIVIKTELCDLPVVFN